MLLMQYPFDTLKIDRSFVARVNGGEKQRAITAAIMALAHAAGMTVVAEGAEALEQLLLLQELGADEIQGTSSPGPCRRLSATPSCAGACDLGTLGA